MELDFYTNKLSAMGIESIVPEQPERDFIQQTIEQELLRRRIQKPL
jgi:aspartate/glutamate racemase